MKSLLVNFTGDNYHWGCYGTARQLASRLGQDGSVEFLPVSYNVKIMVPTVVDSAMYGGSSDFRREHPDVHGMIAAADRVVVNGEGTLHGHRFRGPVAVLTYIAAAKAAGKKVYVINHSVFPNDTTEASEVDAPYAAVLSGVDGVASREIATQRFYERNGIDSIRSFDCLPMYIDRNSRYMVRNGTRESYIVVSNGVSMSLESFDRMIETIASRYSGRRIVYIFGSAGNHAPEDVNYAAHVKASPKYGDRVDVFEAKSFDAFINCISGASLIVTGRFHYVIAAMCTATPFVAIGSNTPKTHVLMSEHRYDGVVLDPQRLDEDVLDDILGRFEGGSLSLKCDVDLKRMVELGAKNFDVLQL